MQLDDGHGKAPGGGNEGMPCFMHGRPVPFNIRKAHAGSVDHHREWNSLTPLTAVAATLGPPIDVKDDYAPRNHGDHR